MYGSGDVEVVWPCGVQMKVKRKLSVNKGSKDRRGAKVTFGRKAIRVFGGRDYFVFVGAPISPPCGI